MCVCWGGGGGRRRGGDCTVLFNALRVILNNVKSGVFFKNLCGEKDLQRAPQNDFYLTGKFRSMECTLSRKLQFVLLYPSFLSYSCCSYLCPGSMHNNREANLTRFISNLAMSFSWLVLFQNTVKLVSCGFKTAECHFGKVDHESWPLKDPVCVILDHQICMYET